MTPSLQREEVLFEAAAKMPIAERAAFLDLKCGSDATLRRRIDALLAAHDAPMGLLENLSENGRVIRVKPADADDEAVGQTIGRYKLLEKIGEGGCGVVYVAEQSVPIRRRVALKVIKLGMDTKQVVARFEAERQALALMDHPNIAKVLDAGATETGRPFFVMELVRGIRITDYCDQNQVSTQERLDLFIRVCHAIQHAHQKGIIHRDIKPSNILLTMHDGIPVPKVIDFGIAKATEGRLTDSTLYTQLHQLIGTPAYMSPEQAEMSALDVDTRSDIYSLGVLLYELLIGRTPFDGRQLVQAGIEAMRRTIRETEPLRPSTRLAGLRGEDLTSTAKHRRIDPPRLVHLLKGDLDWIVMKCLEKDRTRRYETANGLAMDVHRHLHDEPVTARPPSKTYRLLKTMRRHTGAFAAATAFLAALVIGIVLSVSQMIRARLAEDQFRREASRARAAETNAVEKSALATMERIRAETSLYAADMNVVQQALAQPNLRRARERLRAHEPKPGAPDLRGWEWWYFSPRARGDDVFNVRTEGNQVVALASLPNRNQVLIGWENGSVELWDIASTRVSSVLIKVPGGLQAMLLDEAGKTLVTQSDDGVVRIWTLLTSGQAELFRSFPRTGLVRAISSGPKLLAIVAEPSGRWEIPDSDRGLIALWNYETGEKRTLPESGDGAVFSTDGNTLVTGSWRGSVRVWNMVDGTLRKTLPAVGRVLGMSLSPEGRSLVINTTKGSLLSDLSSEEPPVRLNEQSSAATVNHSHFSRDGSRFATAYGHGEIGLWDLSTRREFIRLQGQETYVQAMTFSSDGQWLVSTDPMTETLRVFKTEARTDRETSIGLFSSVVFSPDHRFFAVGDKTGDRYHCALWDLPSRQKRIFPAPPNPVGFADGGATLIIALVPAPLPLGVGRLAGLQHWNVHAGTKKETIYFTETNHLVCAVALSPDGAIIAAGDQEGNVLLREVRTGKKIAALPARSGRVWNLVFSPDGKKLAVGIIGDVAVWDLEKRTRIFTKNCLGTPLAFSPDGHTIAMSTEPDILLCAVADGATEKLTGHRGRVYSLAFSPDGRTLASAAEDLKLWSLAAKREVASFSAEDPFMYVTFSPDGEHLIGGPIGKASIWSAPRPKN